MTIQRTKTEIYEEVQKLAARRIAKHADMTIEEARVSVFEDSPQLYDAYVAAPAGPMPTPIAKAAPETTLAGEILATVKKRADQMLWTRWPEASREDLVYEVFDQHPEVYDLYRAPQSRLPVAVAKSEFAKAAAHQDAWSLLRQWAG